MYVYTIPGTLSFSLMYISSSSSPSLPFSQIGYCICACTCPFSLSTLVSSSFSMTASFLGIVFSRAILQKQLAAMMAGNGSLA